MRGVNYYCRAADLIVAAHLYRKTLYFSPDEWEANRRRAFEEDRPYTEIVREAIRLHLVVPSERRVR